MSEDKSEDKKDESWSMSLGAFPIMVIAICLLIAFCFHSCIKGPTEEGQCRCQENINE